jgi:hypothetical protein
MLDPFIKKIPLLISSAIILSQALPELAIAQTSVAPKDDYAGLRLESGKVRNIPGNVASCVSVTQQDTVTKKQYEWMISQGLLVKSAPDKISFSDKVTSKYWGGQALLIGCWVIESGTVEKFNGGRTFKLATIKFKINSIVKDSPFMETGLCMNIENSEKPLVSVADRQFTEPQCSTKKVNGKDLIVPIQMSQLEGKTQMVRIIPARSNSQECGRGAPPGCVRKPFQGCGRVSNYESIDLNG